MTFNIVNDLELPVVLRCRCFSCLSLSCRVARRYSVVVSVLAYFLAFQGCYVPEGASLPSGIPYYGLHAPLHVLNIVQRCAWHCVFEAWRVW